MAVIKAEIAGKILTLLGYDGTSFQNVKVDADGKVYVKLAAAADWPTGAATWLYQVQMMGFLGTPGAPEAGTVNKRLETLSTNVQNLLPYYVDKLMFRTFTTTAAAGTNILTIAGPAGTAEWVITAVFLMNRTSGMSSSAVSVHNDLVYYYITGAGVLPAYLGLDWSGEVVLKAGDDLKFIYRSCNLNDQLEGIAHGYIRKA